MLTLASVGCAGVNLHGGSRAFLRASLGDHMPGELVSKEGSDAKGGYYTPIDGEVDVGFSPRPIFYGMFLANQLAGAQNRTVTLDNPDGANASAYAGQKGSQLLIAALTRANKPYDLIYFPNGNHHNLYTSYVMKRTWDYFVQYLRGATPVQDFNIGLEPWLQPD